MTAKEYLNQARHIEKRISADLMEACRVRSLAEQVKSTFAAAHGSKMEEAVIKLIELEEIIIGDINALVKARDAIREVIACVKKPEQREVLRLRYLCYQKWEEVCVNTGYEWAQTHRLHASALLEIEKMIRNDIPTCDIM